MAVGGYDYIRHTMLIFVAAAFLGVEAIRTEKVDDDLDRTGISGHIQYIHTLTHLKVLAVYA